MSDEARELHRIISASVRDMLDTYRIQAAAGPVSEQALEEIIFRAAHPIVAHLAPYPAAERVVLLPSIVRLMLDALLEDVAGADGLPHTGPGGDALQPPPPARRIPAPVESARSSPASDARALVG